MQRLTLAGCVLAIVLVSCRTPTEHSVIEVKNEAFKVDIRSQEFGGSGIRDVDVCVADSGDKAFPADKAQCFLHGFDFSGLSVKWLSAQNVDISFTCGRVLKFSNFAILSAGRSVPVEFHAILHDGCNAPLSGEASDGESFQ